MEMNEEEQETIHVSSESDAYDSDLEYPRSREEFRKMFGNGSESDNDTDSSIN